MTSSRLSIGFPYVGDQIGGSGFSSLALAKALIARGHDVRALVHGEGAMKFECEKAGLEIVALSPLSSVSTDARPDRFRPHHLTAIPGLAKIARRLKLDLLVANDLAILRTWAPAAKLAGTPLIAHWRSNYKKSWSVDMGLRLSAKIICISRYNMGDLPPWAQAKSVVEYNPVNAAYDPGARREARARIRAQMNLPTDAKVIGVFGAHTVRKRTHVLADVLNAIPEIGGAPVFGLACGKRAEPYDTLLGEKIAAFGLEHRLLLPGFVRPAEDWMAACDVVLAPAEREPFGRTAFEAALAGAPIVMSSDSGVSELITDGEDGYLVSPQDVPLWIERARDVLTDPVRAEAMAAKALAGLADYAPERHAERVETIYRQVLGR